MEYTELSAYDVPPGVVTTWTPTTDPTAWRDDDRALSPSHEAHLAEGESGSWIGSVLRLPMKYDEAALRLALTAWVARHEGLRTTVTPTDTAVGDGWRRRTVPAAAVDLAATEVGWLGAGHSQRWMADFFATVSPYRWPHCLFATVVHPDRDDFVLAFGADHSVMDAYSQLLWFEEIATLYRRAVDGAGPAELAALDVGSHVDFSARDRAVAAGLDADSAPVTRWRDWLGPELTFPRFPVDVALAEGATLPQTSISVWLAGAEQTDRLNAVCRTLGTSLQSGVLASVSQAFREAFGIERLRYVLPMHTRTQAEDAAAVGWYVGLAPIDIDVAGAADAREIVSRVLDGVNAAKDLVPFPFPRVAELAGIEDVPRFAISYVDTRHVPGADHWDGWDARALRSTAYSGDEVYFWFVRTHEGLNVSSRYPATLAAERAVRALLERISHHVDVIGREHQHASATTA